MTEKRFVKIKKRQKFWWNCKYHKTDTNLGVVFCKKYDNLCFPNKCEELYDTKGKL